MKTRILLLLTLIFAAAAMIVNAQDESMEEDDVLGVVVQQAVSGSFDGETLTLNGVLPVASILFYDEDDDLAATQTPTTEMYNSWKTYGTMEGNEALQLHVWVEVYSGDENYQAHLVVTLNTNTDYVEDEGVFVYDVVEVLEVINILDPEDDKAELPAEFNGASVFVEIDEDALAAWQEGRTEYLNTARPGGSVPTCTFIC
ncbi:MAG: hypothetical protein Kow00117_17250 [Phototrophicales bacterium]